MKYTSKYKIYHLAELEEALEDLDTSKHPEEAEEIKALISQGGYQYPKSENKRPLLITLLVIIGIIGGIAAIPLINSRYVQNIGHGYSYFLGTSIFIAFIYHLGFWFMKKWAVYLYIAMITFSQLIAVKMGLWTPKTLIEPAIVLPIVLSYISRME